MIVRVREGFTVRDGKKIYMSGEVFETSHSVYERQSWKLHILAKEENSYNKPAMVEK